MSAPPALTTAVAGRYGIEAEIGRGGMATVYVASDVKHGRRVAIKVLRREVASFLGPERFLREIRIAARLAHPHIVPLIDSGEADGWLFSVSAYVPGGSLRERLEAEPRLPIPDALRIAGEIGAALDYAHRNGIVHRDIKPENILFADGHAVLTDFGVARAWGGEPGGVVTEAGLLVGTPAYMSPEQASGEQELTAASDIYSLACVLFEMLAGEPPFPSAGARSTLARHVSEPPRSVRSLRPEVPAGVEHAISRALAKDPADRFGRVSDFLLALTRDGTLEADARPARTRSVAVLPFVNASPDPDADYLSDGITDELIDVLSRVRGLRVASRTSVFALKGKPQDVRAVGALLGVSEVLEGTVRTSGERVRITVQLTSATDGNLLWSRRFDREMQDVFAVQEEIAHTIVDTLRATSFADLSEPLLRRYADNAKAYGLYLRGRYEWNKRSQESVAAGIKLFEAAIAEDPGYAPAYTGLADSYALQVDYRNVPVHEGFTRAKEFARQALQLDDSLAEAHASLAWSLFIYDWNWDEAARGFRRAIELAPAYATAHQWYAFLLSARGRHQDALLEGHSAQELDPGSVSIRRSLGWVYYYAGRYDQAVYHLDRAIAMNPEAEESHRILGFSLFQLGQVADAERVLRESLTLPAAGAYARAALGYILARLGRRGEAADLLRSLEEEAGRSYVSPVMFATLYLGLAEWDRALAWIERAMEERRGWVVYLDVNPIFDPLRSHPRFRALRSRVGRGPEGQDGRN